MQLFRSEEDVREWSLMTENPVGLLIPPEQLWQLARRWYDDRLERDYLEPARTRYTAAAWDPAATAGSLLSVEHAIALAIGEPGTDSSDEGSNKIE